MSQSKQYTSSEEYRQMLVRDGQRRYQEWHSKFLEDQQEFQQDSKIDKYPQAGDRQSPRLNSEQYRQMLVRDGQRRYQEWHNKFLEAQRRFLNNS